jgi:hypothetical protein
MVERVPAMLALIRESAPGLYQAFTEAWLGRAGDEDRAMRSLYGLLAPANFSEMVLERRPANLAVLPVRGVVWSDWVEPGRVLRTLDSLDIRPAWAAPAAAVGA